MDALASSTTETPVAVARHDAVSSNRLPWRRVLLSVMVVVAAVVGYQVLWVLAGPNLHEVLPGQVYRAATLHPAVLQAVCQRHGIRTVINLRGCCEDAEWFHDQRRALEKTGVAQCDVNLSSFALPAISEMHKLTEALESQRFPVLIHCRRGADRTGLASALALLLCSDASLSEARGQLSWRYGHLGVTGTSQLSTVLDMYEDWLAEQGQPHRPETLRHWLLVDYQPRHLSARVVALEVPARLPLGRPAAARFRVTNTSRYAWHFRQAAHAGVRLQFALSKPESLQTMQGSAGFFDHTLAPGQSLDLTLALPPVREPGRYRLIVDMWDPHLSWFHLFGSPKFETELTVGDD